MRGTRLGGYELLDELGVGGTGTVWRAAARDGTEVAVKVVHPHLAASESARARVLREGAVGRGVRHANLVATLDAGEAAGEHGRVLYLVLELVRGRTLRALVREMGKLPEALCRHVGCEVAKALAALHAAGIVHRDVKAENVLVTADQVVKLTDLGLARSPDEAARLTSSGVFVGTLSYAAPEQFGDAHVVDARADLYSFGMLLYELASGVLPLEAEDVITAVRRATKETPPRLGTVNPQISPFLEEFVHRLIEKDRALRFQSAAETLSVLEEGEGSPWWIVTPGTVLTSSLARRSRVGRGRGAVAPTK